MIHQLWRIVVAASHGANLSPSFIQRLESRRGAIMSDQYLKIVTSTAEIGKSMSTVSRLMELRWSLPRVGQETEDYL